MAYPDCIVINWIENPYVVESSYFEEDDENDDVGDEEVNDNENSEADHQKGADKGEDTDKDENNPAANMGDDFTQNMNSPPRKNKRIHLSSTSPTDDIEHRGSTPPIGDTTELVIEDEPSPMPSPFPQADIVHHVEMVPPTPSPINVVVHHQGDQGEANSNSETNVLSQLSLIVQLTQSMNKILTKVERNVATMGRLMTLDGEYDDVDTTVDDTPPNSPGDNPPPTLTNPLPPPPPPSHPPPKTPSPPPNSPPQSDAAKKGENFQEVVIQCRWLLHLSLR
ncbi:hypothetical protein Lser_V15G32348 [Lactuca serriola]